MRMMTCKEFKELHSMVDQIYDSTDMTWKEMAKKSGLSYSTVRKLGRYDTMYPRTQTVMLLARAVGLKVQLVQEGSKRRVVT